MRRKQRQQLETDEFLSRVQRTADWIRGNRNTVFAGLAGIVGASLLIGGLVVSGGNRRAALRSELGTLTSQVREAIAAGADADPACGDLVEPLLAIGEDGGSAEGRTARYYAGVCQRELGELEAAGELFGSIRGEADLLSGLGALGEAAAHRAAGRLDEAAGVYRTMLEMTTGVPEDGVLFELALIEEEMGRSEEARILYERIAEEHPDSAFRQPADDRLARLPEPPAT